MIRTVFLFVLLSRDFINNSRPCFLFLIIKKKAGSFVNDNMKKIFLTLIVIFTFHSIYAQIIGNGFYRLQNKNTGRNVIITNDRIHLDTKAELINALEKTTSIDVYALETKDETMSDPASIVYFENVTGKEYNIKGQGMYTKSLTAGRTMKVYQTGKYYELYSTEEGFTVFLKDNNFASSTTNGYCTVATGENGNCVWSINPINDSNYLGIKPEVTVGDKYYTTFYADYAIQLSSGMKSRLAFSIACLVKPDILILDEVLSVGDGAFKKKSEAKMREIIGGGATTILVSHSLAQIRDMCTKVLWLHQGKQMDYGTDVQGICDKYQAFLDKK